MPRVNAWGRVWLTGWRGVGWHRAVIVLSALVLCRSVSGAEAQPTYTVLSADAHATTASVAQPTGPGTTRVTLDVRDSTVAYAVRTLTHQAHLHLLYNGNDPRFGKRITVRVVNATVMDALETVLQGTGLVARLASDGETIMIRGKGEGVPGDRGGVAGGTVVGRVTDSTTGAGLKGAQVQVEGVKGLSTATSDSGSFTLRNVPAGDQLLRVRLFGYRPTTRTVTVVDGERTTVRIAMASVPTVLSGVVTTATGVQRKVEVGNDITTINVDSVMQVAPVSTVTDLLETRVPGLTVQHTSGIPGNPSRIRIRGVSSVSGNNDPIVVVDGIRVYASQSDPRNDNLAQTAYGTGGVNVRGAGVSIPNGYAAPSPVDQIDPASIETIEVLKGPSASALYGSDAANGVIVITTKHGRAGPTHWTLNLGQGVNWLPGKWPIHYFKFGAPTPELNPVTVRASNGYCLWYDPHCHVDSLVPYQALNDPRFSLFTHGQDQTAALTISGGVPTLQYSLTGSAAGNVGNLKLPAWEQQQYEKTYEPVPHWMVRPDNYTTYGIGGQLTAQPTPQARVTLQSSLFNSHQQQGSLQQAITQLEGEYISVVDDTLRRQNSLAVNSGIGVYGPLIDNEVERATAGALTSTNALTLTWQPWSWLPLSAVGGLSTVQRVNETYIPYGVNAVGPGRCYGECSDTTGSYGLGRGTSETKTLNVSTSVPSRWVATDVGVNFYSQSTNDFSAYTSHLAPGVSVPTQFIYANNSGPTQATTASSTYGWFVQPRLNVLSRFFASPGFRLDGGSASGTHGGFNGTGLTGFPKIDFSWIAVDRDQPRGPISLLRPRLAFGYAGTQPGPTQKLRLLNQGGGQTLQLNDSTLVSGVAVSTIGNTQLRPETSRELEGGFDAELWRGRATLTWTQVNKTRYNAIIAVPVAPSAAGASAAGGSYQQYVNIGVVRNTGTELTANTVLVESRAVSWQIGGNLSNDNNRVVRLAPGFAPNKLLGIVPGYPLFSQWAKPIVGFTDANQDGVIEPNEYVAGDSALYVGRAEPKYNLALNTTMTLLDGRLSVNATFDYQNGMTQNNLTALASNAIGLIPNAPGTSLGTQAAFMAAVCGGPLGTSTSIGSDLGSAAVSIPGLGTIACVATPIGLMQTVNTFRFNALSVNYTLPTLFARWLHVPRASLALQGQNLGLHTNYRGLDPNVNAFSTVSAGDQTADLGQLPQPRIWWLKLNLGN